MQMIPQQILTFLHGTKSWSFRSMTFFNFLLEATLAGSLLILVVLVLRRVFRRQVGSRLVYLAWALVALRLLLPIAIPNPLMDEYRPTHSTDVLARPVADQLRIRFQDEMGSAAYALNRASVENGSHLGQGLSALMHDISAYTSYGWLGKAYLMCYAAGAMIVVGIFSVRHIRFRRQLQKNTIGTLELEQLALYQALCKRLKVRELPVVLVDPLPSPCLVGVWKPVIALPLTLAPENLSEALTHELCHYKARDSWWTFVQCVCCVVHWFNPLVWIAQKAVRMDCEFACDARVAASLTDSERLHYANTLVSTAQKTYRPRSGVLSTGMTMTGKKLKRRVSALLHIKAVQKTAAAILAVLLVALTAAAFSTAESTAQTKYLASDKSAFPFQKTDVYPLPAVAFGEPIPQTPSANATEAKEQAKRYLLMLYPNDQQKMEAYRFNVQTLWETFWEITVWPPEGGETPHYYMSLRSDGSLDSVNAIGFYSDGFHEDNIPSILPENLREVLLAYGQQLSAIAFQNFTPSTGFFRADVDTSRERYVVFDLYDADGVDWISMTVQIAPSFQLLGIYNHTSVSSENTAEENFRIEAGTQTLTYSKDAALSFEANYWGHTDSTLALSPDAILTVQQAFDIAMDTMLERSGLTKEELLQLPLHYGYYDKSNFNGNTSDWRFTWLVDPASPMDRFWVSVDDDQPSSYISFSAPGEGLG